MHADALVSLPVESLATALARREMSAVDVVEAFLARIDERDPLIHAWTVVDADGARRRAASLDEGPIRGPLHGLPIGVKDVIDTADFETAYGSSIYAGHRPPADAACVEAALAAGAIVLGKTSSTEFATFKPTATVNPHDTSRTPGGSSSGSAAAVADRMAALAFGTQTLGSVIRPASYCGVVGYKPTFGTIPVDGVKLIAPSLDTVGVFADSVEAAARFAGAVAGRPDLAAIEAPASAPRIGICRTHEWSAAEPETIAVLERAAGALAAAGADVAQCELPAEYAALRDANEAIYGFELAANLTVEREQHGALLSDRLRASVDAARRITRHDYRRALEATEVCRARFADHLGDRDVLLTASTPGEAPRGLTSTGSPVMNRLWTLLGVPAVNVPAYRSPAGLPVGLQVIGRQHADARMLGVAAWIFDRLRSDRDDAADPGLT